jgi:hypothetical protein
MIPIALGKKLFKDAKVRRKKNFEKKNICRIFFLQWLTTYTVRHYQIFQEYEHEEFRRKERNR